MSKNHSPEVDKYIANFPDETQAKLTQLRDLIHKTVSGLEEKISYGIPTFSLNGQYVIYIAGFKKHVSIYPFPSGIEAFKEETKEYKTATGTIQFPLNEPLPLELITRIIKFRAEEAQKKATKKY